MGLTFSIIIPTFNRCAALERTLNSLIKIHKQGKNYEVLIVNNGSTDGTSAMVEGFRSQLQFRVMNESMPGLLSARHRGAMESAGDICVFIDDDVRLDPEWLNALQDGFKDPSVILVGGPSRPLFEVEQPLPAGRVDRHRQVSFVAARVEQDQAHLADGPDPVDDKDNAGDDGDEREQGQADLGRARSKPPAPDTNAAPVSSTNRSAGSPWPW